MQSSISERKLAAIMFTDIVGYTKFMSISESKSLDILDKKRSIFKPLLTEFNGTFVKEIGDGTLSYFDSAINAAKCAVKLQENTYGDSDINIRAGINIGDIVFKDGDVFGDGVNVASRLESIAPEGGICVAKNVYDELINQDGFDAISLGLQSFKGVGRLVEVYGLKGEKINEPNPDVYLKNKIEVHSDDEVPSIAIIPFDNKGVEADIFYAYGISADLISDCSSAGLIRVASLKDVEKLDYKNLETANIAKKLLVRYIAQGTLWKKGNMFQLSLELYDTKDKKVIWSDRWQEKWENLPEIKSRISDCLLKALDSKPKVENNLETFNPKAYELYLRAKHKYEKRDNTDDTEIARGLLEKSIDLDKNLILSKSLLGITYTHIGNYDKAMKIFITTVKQAQELKDKFGIAQCLYSIGNVMQYKSNFDSALDYYLRALTIREELGDQHGIAYCLNNIGIAYKLKGDLQKAVEHYEKSLEINYELADMRGQSYCLNNLGQIFIKKGDFKSALEYYEDSLDISKKINDKQGIGNCLNNLAELSYIKSDYNKSLDYLEKAFLVREEIGSKHDMAYSLYSLGLVNYEKGALDVALNYYTKSLEIRREINYKEGIAFCQYRIGNIYKDRGSYDSALDYYFRTLKIREEMGNQYDLDNILYCIGVIYFFQGKNKKAVQYLNNSLDNEQEINQKEKLERTVYLYLAFRYLGKKFSKRKIYDMITKTEKIDLELNFRLYELIGDQCYLKTAYNQLQEKSSSMGKKMKKSFFELEIATLILENWKKVD